MKRTGWLLLLLLAGCGGSHPPVPTVDAQAEQRDAEALRLAGAAERTAKPTAEN